MSMKIALSCAMVVRTYRYYSDTMCKKPHRCLYMCGIFAFALKRHGTSRANMRHGSNRSAVRNAPRLAAIRWGSSVGSISIQQGWALIRAPATLPPQPVARQNAAMEDEGIEL
jgi:hypothetical protein